MRALYSVTMLIAMLVLCGCDPMYRFKYTKFAAVSPALRGPETKVTQITEDGLRTIAVERDGIIVKPSGGGNSLNHEWIRIAITNMTESQLAFGLKDVSVLVANTPLHIISIITRNSEVHIEKVLLDPNAGEGDRFVVAPHSSAEMQIDLGIRAGSKFNVEVALTHENSQTQYVYRFRTAMDSP